MSSLMRGELELARLELTEKAKHTGKGAGAFGAAGLVALYGVAALIAAAIIALALVMDAWLAAVLVGVVLLVIAGGIALFGKKQVSEGTPMKPERATENLRRDVDAVKHRHAEDHTPRSTP
ncbi:phage holin family protein [Nocardioides sp. NBC_00163]